MEVRGAQLTGDFNENDVLTHNDIWVAALEELGLLMRKVVMLCGGTLTARLCNDIWGMSTGTTPMPKISRQSGSGAPWSSY